MSRPVLEAALGIALLSVMDAFIKGLVTRYPVVEVAFIRYLVGSFVMTSVVAVRRPGWPGAATIRANALRAVLVVVTAVTFFTALGLLPLAETLILSFVSPIFTALFAALILGERADRRIVAALAAGFAGVLVIVLGDSVFNAAPAAASSGIGGRSILGVAAVLASSVTYAASNVLLRARAQRDPVIIIVAIQNVAPCAMLALPAWWFGHLPDPADLPRLAILGLLGVSGHLLLARAYAKTEAMRLAPLDYTALIWAVLIGFFAYGEVPNAAALAGAVLILGAAFATSRRRQAPPDGGAARIRTAEEGRG